MPTTTIVWHNDKIRIIDQTRLPEELVHIDIDRLEDLCEAIRQLRVRGAPALGVAAAYGVLLSLHTTAGRNKEESLAEAAQAMRALQQTRPTAVSISWALQRMQRVLHHNREHTLAEITQAVAAEAHALFEEDRRDCRALGRHGAALVPEQATVMTYCNAGALATADFGTALGVLFAAHAQGKQLHVYVNETRPLLQGARLTAWELMQEGIPCTLICDNTAAFVMQRQAVDCCIVGADRIARNGDTANKIGTYSLAVNAHRHGLPFYVAAPLATIDSQLASGTDIPIEERSAEEVTRTFGRRTAPEGCRVYSPAFDVTPHELITAIITEAGVVRPPFDENLAALLQQHERGSAPAVDRESVP